MISVTVNGTPTTFADPPTLDALVADLRPDRRGIAVARNDEVVPRSTWADVVVDDGDRIEILSAAQGG